MSKYMQALATRFPPYRLADLQLEFKNFSKVVKIKKVISRKRLYPGFSWFITEIYDGVNCTSGTGEESCEKVAKLKSICEAIERYSLVNSSLKQWKDISLVMQEREVVEKKLNLKSSNGLSFHLNIQNAIENSIYERLERHVVLNNWLYKKKCYKIPKIRFRKGLYSILHDTLNCVKSTFLYIPNPYSINVVACIIKTKNNNIFIGYGCSPILKNAFEKSYYESWRFYLNFESLSSADAKDGDVNQRNKCIEHFFEYSNGKVNYESIFNVTKSLLFKNIKRGEALNERVLHKLRMYLLDLKEVGLAGYSVKVESDSFLELWTGPLESNKGKRCAGEWHPVA